MAAYAIRKPSSPPRTAVQRLISMLVLYASMYWWLKTSPIVDSDHCPSTPLNAPRMTSTAGMNRKRSA
jgi:hypothetical protein